MTKQNDMNAAVVVAVHRKSDHSFSKDSAPAVELIAGHGVQDDAHAGATVKHRSRVAKDPTQPNLRQVHLLNAELFDDLRERGFVVIPGQMGENITTRGLDLLALSAGSLLRLGSVAIVRVTGLRNPCAQIDQLQSGLCEAMIDRASDGSLVRKVGIMGVVEKGGWVHAGDPIVVSEPTVHVPLQVV